MQSREVTIHEARLESYSWPIARVWIRCGKGVGSMLTALVRTRVGPFTIDRAIHAESLPARIGSHWIIAGCDPSLGVKNGDYSAIVILAKSTTTKRCYVLVSDIARRTPDEIIERLCHYHQMYGFRRLAVESNQFQVMLVKQLKERLRQQTRPMPSVTCLESRSNKGSRILSLEPELAQGRLIMARTHKTLNDQLMAFPVAKHDDGPDALEMAMSEAAKYSGGCGRVNL